MRLSLLQQAEKERDCTTCFCGGPKPTGYAFCGRCFRELPSRLKNQLAMIAIGTRYAELYDSAKDFLMYNTDRVNAMNKHEITEAEV